MGCNTYSASGRIGDQWEEFSYLFPDMDDEVRCLCTFPQGMDNRTIRSLAYLGAAVAMGHNGELDSEYNLVPYCLPDDIRQMIDSALPVEPTEPFQPVTGGRG